MKCQLDTASHIVLINNQLGRIKQGGDRDMSPPKSPINNIRHDLQRNRSKSLTAESIEQILAPKVAVSSYSASMTQLIDAIGLVSPFNNDLQVKTSLLPSSLASNPGKRPSSSSREDIDCNKRRRI